MQQETTGQRAVAVTSPKTFALSEFTDFKPAEIELIRQTVAKNTTDLELAYFLKIAQGVNLNPLVKEIWCYKDKKNNIMIFAGRDGFRTIAQQNPKFVSLNSMEVRARDKFEMGSDENGNMFVKHSFGAGERGATIGAYAIVKLSDGGQVVEWVEMKVYNKGWNTWKSHPDEMIKKVAEVHALKKMSNIRGIYTEEEFNVQNNRIVGDVSTENNLDNEPVVVITDTQINEIETLVKYKGRNMEKMLAHFKKEKIRDFTNKEANGVIELLKSMPDVAKTDAGEPKTPEKATDTKKDEKTQEKQERQPKSEAGKKIKAAMDKEKTDGK